MSNLATSPQGTHTPAPSLAGGKSRFVLVGTGSRSEMYVRAILGAHSDVAELVAISDVNPGRVEHYRGLVKELGAHDGNAAALDCFEPAGLADYIQEHRIDRVIVTTPDYTHADYIVTALHAGADVIVEKPLTIDVDGCQRIAAAMAETGRNVIVTFNYRYSPRNSALKEIIQNGVIGKVTSIDFSWVLDTVHGADYFRRWHREKKYSGGLLIHKASHHFDLVNWWINDSPARVYASGGLRFYGAENAAARGLGERPVRGSVDRDVRDPFALDLREDTKMRALYFENEKFDGYLRDQDVFSNGITIEDNLALTVDYDGGPTLSYSLNAHSPWEGYRVSINGTEGRAELEVVERAAVHSGEGEQNVVDPSANPIEEDDAVRRNGERLVVQRHWEPAYEVPIINGDGGHGGGDILLLADLFNGPGDDPLGRPSGVLDGLRSVSVGIAGNESLATGLPVRIRELVLGTDLSKTESRPAQED